MHSTTHNTLAQPLASPIFKSILIGLPVAIVAVGAADKADLPFSLQRLVSLLDIASHLPPVRAFANPDRAFEFWVLPINAAFYSALTFLLLLLRSYGFGFGRKMVEGLAGQGSAPRYQSDQSNIPSLAVVLEPNKLARQLAPLPIFQWGGALRQVQVRVLKVRENQHCTFEISLLSGLVGKVFATDRQDLYEFMESLRQAGFVREAEFTIPQPIAYLPTVRLLLQEKVEGMLVKGILKLGDAAQRVEASERCARWLAKFHALAPRTGKVTSPDDLLRRWERKCQLIASHNGSPAAKAHQLLQRLKTARMALGEAVLCAGHGDFGTYQVIQDGRRTVVFDWDLHDLADPMRDVARFLVSLERQALRQRGSLDGLDRERETFLKTYLAINEPSQFDGRLPFYRAGFYLASAAFDLRNRPQPRRDWAETMLDAGLGTLNE